MKLLNLVAVVAIGLALFAFFDDEGAPSQKITGDIKAIFEIPLPAAIEAERSKVAAFVAWESRAAIQPKADTILYLHRAGVEPNQAIISSMAERAYKDSVRYRQLTPEEAVAQTLSILLTGTVEKKQPKGPKYTYKDYHEVRKSDPDAVAGKVLVLQELAKQGAVVDLSPDDIKTLTSVDTAEVVQGSRRWLYEVVGIEIINRLLVNDELHDWQYKDDWKNRARGFVARLEDSAAKLTLVPGNAFKLERTKRILAGGADYYSAFKNPFECYK